MIALLASRCTAAGMALRNSSNRARSALRQDRTSSTESVIEITPRTHLQDAKGDHRRQIHRRVLRIAALETVAGSFKFRAGSKNLAATADHDPTETRPIFVVTIGDECCLRILLNIAYSPQAARTFRFFVQRGIEGIVRKRKTHRYDTWNSGAIGRCQMADPLPGYENAFAWRQYHRRRFCLAMAIHSRCLRR